MATPWGQWVSRRQWLWNVNFLSTNWTPDWQQASQGVVLSPAFGHTRGLAKWSLDFNFEWDSKRAPAPLPPILPQAVSHPCLPFPSGEWEAWHHESQKLDMYTLGLYKFFPHKGKAKESQLWDKEPDSDYNTGFTHTTSLLSLGKTELLL